MIKADLRKKYLDERLSLSERDVERLNRDICENFFSRLDISGISVLHSFLPMEKTKEPDTWMIINEVKEKFPDIRISIPKINTQAIIIENFFYEGPEQLKTNAWGIPEPAYGVPTPTEDIEMILVPMLIADKSGHRVGYGKGFYDKFLSTCEPSCVPVGLCFYDPIDSIDDINNLDMPLKYCVTPFKVHQF
jgi:5-formyltetrahydrofolate cyclo-ligase